METEPWIETVRRGAWPWAWVWGPGLLVMLADTDAGSLITAAQSGAQWGYRMVLPQVILIPILYMVQEVTVRLGLVTREGHGEAIRRHFGRGWAFLSAGTLFLSAIGALVTEFSGVAGVGQLFGVPPAVSVGLATLLLIAVGLSGSYRRVERIGIAMGLFELLFVVVAVWARPAWGAVWQGTVFIPWSNPSYLQLLAANIGAVIMPWMIFYQQGAVVDKGLAPTVDTLRQARADTAVGSVVTQAVMVAMVVAVAATLGRTQGHASLDTVGEIAGALEPFLGHWVGAVVFGLGMLGASLVAALVVSVAGSWGLGEVLGFPHSLNHRVDEAPWFYAVYTAAHVAGALLVIASTNLVGLTVDVEIMNALLLPIVLGFLLALEARALPAHWRMRGMRRALVWGASGLVMAFGLYTLFTL
ncbi:MAG: divalent metal cation transporter [Firmicutes bacterium]|nr:divalent metal cation transporter [Alicyclobacillaceae bacterium]MCL6496038.1 divalent metal cation transporter [Bacillota bacterium]